MKKEKNEKWMWVSVDGDEPFITDMQDCILFNTSDIELVRPATDEEVAEHFTKEQGGTVKVDAEGVKYYSF
jgi:hypothetical protein